MAEIVQYVEYVDYKKHNFSTPSRLCSQLFFLALQKKKADTQAGGPLRKR